MRRLLFTILALALLCPVAYATPISLISETHHVWGRVSPDPGWGPRGSYDATSYNDIRMSISDVGHGNYSVSEAGNYDVYASAGSSGGAVANAESRYVFTAGGNQVGINYHGYATVWDSPSVGQTSIMLRDLTTNNQMLNFSTPEGPVDMDLYSFFELEGQFSFPALYGHEYELMIAAYADVVEGGHYATMSANLVSAPIPEPSTIVLMSLGIAGLAGFNRKKIIK